MSGRKEWEHMERANRDGMGLRLAFSPTPIIDQGAASCVQDECHGQVIMK